MTLLFVPNSFQYIRGILNELGFAGEFGAETVLFTVQQMIAIQVFHDVAC